MSSQSPSADLVSGDPSPVVISTIVSCVTLGHSWNHFDPPALALKQDIGDLVLKVLVIGVPLT